MNSSSSSNNDTSKNVAKIDKNTLNYDCQMNPSSSSNNDTSKNIANDSETSDLENNPHNFRNATQKISKKRKMHVN